MKRKALLYSILLLISFGLLKSDSMSLLVGQFRPAGQSDIWEINNENLGIGPEDFYASMWYFEWEHVRYKSGFFIGVGSYNKTVHSEYIDWVDEYGNPIPQSVQLKETPLYLGWRYYPITPRKRNGVFPYISIGIAYVGWTFRQFGSFIDFTDYTIFEGDYRTEKDNFGFFLNAGMILKVDRRFGIRVAAFYHKASGDLEPAFIGFEPLDLSGLSLMIGLTVLY